MSTSKTVDVLPGTKLWCHSSLQAYSAAITSGGNAVRIQGLWFLRVADPDAEPMLSDATTEVAAARAAAPDNAKYSKQYKMAYSVM